MIFTVQIKVIEPMVMSSFFFGRFMAERKSGTATYACIYRSDVLLQVNQKTTFILIISFVTAKDKTGKMQSTHILGGQNRSLQNLKPSIIEGRRMS
jgi:hypothetical protein